MACKKRRVRLTSEARRKGRGRRARKVIARDYSGFYELSSGSPTVWAMVGGQNERETPEAVESLRKDAFADAVRVFKKAGILSEVNWKRWDRRDSIAASGGKVYGVVHLIGDYSDVKVLDVLRAAGIKEGRP